jgi:hypothetical protein
MASYMKVRMQLYARNVPRNPSDELFLFLSNRRTLLVPIFFAKWTSLVTCQNELVAHPDLKYVINFHTDQGNIGGCKGFRSLHWKAMKTCIYLAVMNKNYIYLFLLTISTAGLWRREPLIGPNVLPIFHHIFSSTVRTNSVCC